MGALVDDHVHRATDESNHCDLSAVTADQAEKVSEEWIEPT